MSTHNIGFYEVILISTHNKGFYEGARWPSGSDSRGRGLGFDPNSGRHVSLSMTHFLPKSTGNNQEEVAPSRHD